jgi:hypothetical protein
MSSYDEEWVRQAVLTVGDLQVHSHFGGEFYRDDEGRVQLKRFRFGRPLPDYAGFLTLMKEIDYDGYFCYELCHPVLSDTHEPLGLEYVDEQARLAQEFMSALIEHTPTK